MASEQIVVGTCTDCGAPVYGPERVQTGEDLNVRFGCRDTCPSFKKVENPD